MITSAQQGRTFQAGDDVKIEISPEAAFCYPRSRRRASAER